MADKTFVMRLQLENGEVVVRGLDEIGDKGEAAGRKIRRATEVEASPGLRAMTTATGEAQRGIEGLASRAGTLGTVLSSIGPTGILVAAGIGAAVIGLAALSRQAIQTVADLDQLQDIADKLTIGTDTIQSLRLAAREAGFEFANADASIQALRDARLTALSGMRGSERAQAGFTALGISRDDLSRIEDMETLLQRVARGANEMGDQGRAAAVLFRMGLDSIAQGLIDAEGNLEGLNQKNREAGRIVDEELVQRAAELTGQWEEMATKLSVTVTPAFIALGNAATPVLEFIADKLREIIGMFNSESFNQGIEKLFRTGLLTTGGQVLRGLAPGLQIGQDLNEALAEDRPAPGATATVRRDLGSLPTPALPSPFLPNLDKQLEAYAEGIAEMREAEQEAARGAAATARADAEAKRAATEAARELAAAERLVLDIKGKAAQADAKLREQIEGLTRARQLGVIATDAEYDALVRQATAKVDVERNAWLTDANKQAVALVETLKTADFTTEGVNARFDLMGRILSGNVTTLDDLLNVLVDIVAQLAQAAAMGAANNEGSFWSLFGDALLGFAGLGGGGGAGAQGSANIGGGSGGQFGGPRAGGGPVEPGKFYLVNENKAAEGPEYLVAGGHAMVLNAGQMAARAGAAPEATRALAAFVGPAPVAAPREPARLVGAGPQVIERNTVLRNAIEYRAVDRTGDRPVAALVGPGSVTPGGARFGALGAPGGMAAMPARAMAPSFDPAQLMALAGGGGGGRERAAAPVVNIMPTVTNNTGQAIETETKTSQDGRGNVTIETILKPMVKQAQRENVRSGSMDKAMTERSGVRPRLRPV